MEFVSLGLLGILFLVALLSLKFEASLANDWSILGLEVPNLPADFCSNGDPMAPGVEGETVDRRASIVAGSWFFDITEVKNPNLLIFSSSDNEVSSGGDGDSVDAAVVHLDAVLDVESLVVPDLEVAVPADRGEVLSAYCRLGGRGDEPHLRHPVVVVVLLHRVLAVALHVPQFDLSVRSRREDVPSVG